MSTQMGTLTHKQFLIDPENREWLRDKAHRERISESELLRNMLTRSRKYDESKQRQNAANSHG